MLKKIANRFALVLALTLLTSPINRMQGQAAGSPPPPTIITGGDPQPIQPSVVWIAVIPILVAIVAA